MNTTQSIRDNILAEIYEDPAAIGRQLGFTKLEDLHSKWIQDMMFGSEDDTLQAHRGSYKTTCASLSMFLLLIIQPNMRTAFIRKTDDDVKDIIGQIKKMLQSDYAQYICEHIWGTSIFLTVDNAKEISTNLTNDPRGGAQLVGRGIKGSITGKHYDLIFTDDIVNVEDRVSKAERDKTRLFYQELQNVKNRGGRIFNSGTPWHKEDAFEIMPTAKKYTVYDTGLISDVEQKEIKSKMLPSLYAANYELKHIASEDVIFTNPQTDGDPSFVLDSNYCHIDAAYGGSDYTAFTVCKKKDGKYYVLGKLWQKHVDDCVDAIIRTRKSVRGGRIYCEDNGDKGYLAKALRRQGETVTTYTEHMNKMLKICSYLKFDWNNVIFVKGTDKEYIQQIEDYTEEAEHDDAPDSLATSIRLQINRSDTPYHSPFGG